MRFLGLLLAFSAIGCSLRTVATAERPEPGPTTAEEQGYIAYGGAGHLSAEELVTLEHLGWPQTYTDMKGTFGFPSEIHDAEHVYIAPDGRRLTITYNGDQATGYHFQ